MNHPAEYGSFYCHHCGAQVASGSYEHRCLPIAISRLDRCAAWLDQWRDKIPDEAAKQLKNIFKNPPTTNETSMTAIRTDKQGVKWVLRRQSDLDEDAEKLRTALLRLETCRELMRKIADSQSGRHTDEYMTELHDLLLRDVEGRELHPEDRCQRCGGPNIVWFTQLWREVIGEEDRIICPICFVAAAQSKGYANAVWQIGTDDVVEGREPKSTL